MDEFRGGNFIIGSNIKENELRRVGNEQARNQNEETRTAAEGKRNSASAAALGIAQTHSKSNFLTQIGLFVAIILTIVILAVISVMAYERATNNRSLVDLNNIRDLTLSNLDVLDTTELKTLDVSSTSNLKTTIVTGGLSVTGTVDVDTDVLVDGGVSVVGGMSIGGKSYLYQDLRLYQGMSIDGNLTVSGTTTLYDILTSDSGVSTTAGLSIGGVTHLYDNLISTGGISTTSGLSVGGATHLYGNLISTGGISTTGGLSVGGVTHLYGNLISDSGISTSAGLSVGGTANIEIAKIKKDSVILTTSLEGASSGYFLSTEDAGHTYIIQNEYAGISVPINFILPNISGTGENGLKYNFLWDENRSGIHNNFKIHTYDSDNNIFGTVLTGQKGTSVITLAQSNTNITVNSINTGPPVLFHYDGTLYPGSQLECNYMNGNWLLQGSLGTSTDYTSNNGFVGINNPTWILSGVSNGTGDDYLDDYLISYNGDHFYNCNPEIRQLDSVLQYIAYGNSSNGANIWASVLYKSFNPLTGASPRYSTNGTCWLNSTGAGSDLVGFGIAYGTSEGTSRWVSTGGNADGTKTIIYSENGVSWENCTGSNFGNDGFGYTVAYGTSSDGTSIWVAGGANTNDTGQALLYSVGGISWNVVNSDWDDAVQGRGVAYGLSSDNATRIWGAVGTSNALLYSLNGTDWSYAAGASFAGTGGVGFGIGFGLSTDGTCIWGAVGYCPGQTNLLYSADCQTWSLSNGASFTGTYKSGCDIKYGTYDGTGKWLAVGHTGDKASNVLYSADCQTWTAIESGDFTYDALQTIANNTPLYPNPENAVEN